MKAYTTVHTRLRVKSDIDEMLRIERASFSIPWTKSDFEDTLQTVNAVTFVAENDNQIIGYVVAEVYAEYISLINVAVAPEYRRFGVATQLIHRLTEKLTNTRTRIVAGVRETNLIGQQFLRALEFRAVKVMKNYYDQVHEDCYIMEYRSDWSPDGIDVLRSIMSGDERVVRATSL